VEISFCQVKDDQRYGNLPTSLPFCSATTQMGKDRFVHSFVIAGRGPAYSGLQRFMSVQCASPGRGGELVGVCGVCASCVGWRKG